MDKTRPLFRISYFIGLKQYGYMNNTAFDSIQDAEDEYDRIQRENAASGKWTRRSGYAIDQLVNKRWRKIKGFVNQ